MIVVWEALGSALIGFALAYTVARCWPQRRLPARSLVLSTGPVAALLGTFPAHAVLGSGHAAATLLTALVFTVAMLSLLVRPRRPRHAATAVRRSATA
ncbi:hypothetical protein [Streptomyces sp. XD-27]|uniref:hypothetical protein n=1 Tax=Streptomyces sp. XD-27 TaxID=3062779 RepID=UPI00350E3536